MSSQVAQHWPPVQQALEETHRVMVEGRGALSAGAVHTGKEWFNKLYNACREDIMFRDNMMDTFGRWIRSHLASTVRSKVDDLVRNGDPDEVFATVTREVAAWTAVARLAHFILLSVATPHKERTVHEMQRGFKHVVYDSVKERLRNVALRQVGVRRDGNQVNMAQLRNATAVFTDIGTSEARDDEERLRVYQDDFENAYVDEAEAYYKQRAAAVLGEEGGHFTYLKWVESRLDLESWLRQDLLRHWSTKQERNANDDLVPFPKISHDRSLQRVWERVIAATVVPFYEGIVSHPDSGCGALLQDWRVDDLGRMYRVLSPVILNEARAALNLMGQEMQQQIIDEGEKLMDAFCGTVSDGPLSLEVPLVSAVMELNRKYGNLIKERFEGSGIFYDYRKKAFTHFLKQKLTRKDPKPAQKDVVDTKPTSFSEVLAAYCDAVMKRDLKDVVDPDAELERLDALLQVFTYIEEKDVFQEYYKVKLAKRLLQTTPNEDLEKAFLERLQREMGKSFTHKMEGMLLDRDTTRMHAERFKEDSASAGLGCEFDVQVLTEANWPSYKPDTMVPPLSLRRCVEAFTRFYKRSNATKKLTWINQLGQATVQVKFPKGSKDVTASLYQASVLMTIDELGSASVSEIAETLQLDTKAVKPHIAAMYMHKMTGMLNRVDESGAKLEVAKTINDGDRFAMNEGFMHKMRKFKLTSASTHASSAGNPTDAEIDGRRKIQVDAAVVRIMKSRKTLAYQDLQDLVISQLSRQFVPQPRLIKMRVEELVTREYLRRHEDDPRMFDYLA